MSVGSLRNGKTSAISWARGQITGLLVPGIISIQKPAFKYKAVLEGWGFHPRFTMSNQSVPKTNSLYAQDYHLWLEYTVDLLKNKKFLELELENLIEEIESMGRSDKNALRSNLRVLLMHLLKYKFQPQNRSNSWLYTIYEHRQRLQEAFVDSPSLKYYYTEVFDSCYQHARKEASIETGLPLSIFPKDYPFSVDETLDSDFFPN